jgi:tripartite-type tricarboxylate transporter receptor subunit TctC
LTVHPSVPAKSIKELIAYAKAKPGVINFASTGTGGATHLQTELFIMLAGIKMTHVPYKGTGPAVIDTISGQVQLTISPIPALRPHVLAGRLRALGVTSLKRNPAFPDIPPIADTVPDTKSPLVRHVGAEGTAEGSREHLERRGSQGKPTRGHEGTICRRRTRGSRCAAGAFS